MKVAMLISITGTRDGVEWPPVGGTIDLPDSEAADLISVGYAREVTDGDTEPDGDAEPETEPDGDTDTDGDAEPETEPVPTRSKRTRKN